MIKREDFIKADIAEYERRIAYCDNIIEKTKKTKEMWQKRLDKKRRALE